MADGKTNVANALVDPEPTPPEGLSSLGYMKWLRENRKKISTPTPLPKMRAFEELTPQESKEVEEIKKQQKLLHAEFSKWLGLPKDVQRKDVPEEKWGNLAGEKRSVMQSAVADLERAIDEIRARKAVTSITNTLSTNTQKTNK